MARLKDKVAVVTGSGSGMGEGIARLFAEEGARLVISDRDLKAAETFAASLTEQGFTATARKADVSSEADCRALIDDAVAQFGRIDVLVNTVGWSKRGTIEDTTVAEWDGIFAVNVRGTFICSQQAVKHMKEQGSGSIINIGSVNAYIGEPKLMAYSAAKGALDDFDEKPGQLPQSIPHSRQSTERRLDADAKRTPRQSRRRRQRRKLAGRSRSDSTLETLAGSARSRLCRTLFRQRRKRTGDGFDFGYGTISSGRSAELVGKRTSQSKQKTLKQDGQDFFSG
jgi:hypothetical protein